ncbi:putative DNA-binding WGR domain protein [Kitasatospora gansuensis]|uniref:Putative DNA-binding WGR domain protein n=1 Tax=Kitasatospora gansuensis TaxID=258050 RepID=A0A7W7SJI0_9ACTN|nr:DUF4132 domain-containing protein [Kitasatospora gansuensis]MBB4950456.1 putative DNA-binding WGR domain protein [Kitasatospora gansuensis]
MRRWEYVGEGSAKFWEAAAEGCAVTVRFGRNGTAGREQVKEFPSAEAALAHLAKVVAEKERKGYRETGAAEALPQQAPPAAPVEPAAQADQPAERPDEDTVVLPANWLRALHPRRGGTPRSVTPPAKDAAQKLRQRLADDADWIERSLTNDRSQQVLVAAARRYQAGEADPLGAAVLAALTDNADTNHRVTADAWVLTHGLTFAALATVELLGMDGHGPNQRYRSSKPVVRLTPPDSAPMGIEERRSAADRVRALLTVADEATYLATVAALAEVRDNARRRILVSYLVPSEAGWVAECCEKPGAVIRHSYPLRSMLFASLDSAEQVELLGGRADLGWQGWSVATIATIADGLGPATARLLINELDGPSYLSSDTLKALATALAELPSDEAFGALLARVEDRNVRVAVLAAARRFPVRALRMLAEASTGGTPAAAAARQLLPNHVTAHQELVLRVLPELDPAVAELVAPLAAQAERIPDAAAEALPTLLTSPPWTRRRTGGKPPVVAGLIRDSVAELRWRAGEQDEWANTTSGFSDWQPDERTSWPTLVAQHRKDRLNGYQEVGLFLRGPVELVQPLLTDWAGPEYLWDGLNALKPLVARHGLAALPMLRRLVTTQPGTLAPLLFPYLDGQVARLMADWLDRLKSAAGPARSWFTRHGAAAAALLIPDALGPAGPARRSAEGALRLIVTVHGPDAVRSAATGFGAEAARAVEVLLTADPLEAALPARLPVVGDWADAPLLPQIVLRSGGAVPVAAARHLVTMLAISRPGAMYPGVDEVRALCAGESLAGFGWALFEQWRLAGMPAKDSWVLRALGWLGDDETVRRLTPVLRNWPGEGAHQRAVDGLDVLADIGSDVALMHLHGIAQRVKFKALKTRAQEKITEVAAGLGLSAEQLADRLVPDFGLDAHGSTVIEYGPRRFTVGFDEQLKPYVLDEDGKRRKDLPAPGAKDDAELAPAERKRFAALKKDVRTVAADQVHRLEVAMVGQRSWTATEFGQLFVGHPLLWHLVRRLVWLAETDGRAVAFRVAEDRSYAGVEDETLTLPADALVRLAHPLHLGAELAAWAELFADYEILQPFPQLGRQVHTLTEQEADGARLHRFEGVKVPTVKLLGLQRRGWDRGDPQDAGVERWISRRLGPGRYLVLAPDEGIAVGAIDIFPEQRIETVWLDTTPGDHRPSRTYPLRFGDLDPVIASELLGDLTELTEPTGN